MTLLSDRRDFPELIGAAAEHFGIPNAAIVEKDYYVTEALRTIARDFGTRTLFKGGTSLSKGWRIIDRFSEDIDLYVDREDRGAKATNTLLKSVEAAVAATPPSNSPKSSAASTASPARPPSATAPTPPSTA